MIPALNRDGDILSDLVLPLFGSIAGSESLLVAFEDDFEPAASWPRPRTAPRRRSQGKNVANPMAMILARRRAALAHERRGPAGRPRDPRGVPRGGRAGHPHRRPRRRPRHDRVHRRGDRRVRAKLEVWARSGAGRGRPAPLLGPDFEEQLGDDRVELGAGAAADLLERPLRRQRRAVRARATSSRRTRPRRRAPAPRPGLRCRGSSWGSRCRPSARGGRGRTAARGGRGGADARATRRRAGARGSPPARRR